MTRGYAGETTVPIERSQGEIQALLRKRDADSFFSGWDGDKGFVAFRLSGRHIRITVPMPDPEADEFIFTPTGKERSESAAKADYERAVRARWRVMLLLIKAKLEAIDIGVQTLEEAFLGDVVLPSGQTFGQWAEPELKRVYELGVMPPLLALGPGRE